MKGRIFGLIAMMFIQSTVLNAQLLQGPLPTDKNLSFDISSKESHRFTIQLEGEQLTNFELVQKGIDVVITTYNVEGQKIKDFDSPNGKSGSEFFHIKSDVGGIYGIEVKAIDQNGLGSYDIGVIQSETLAGSPEQQMEQLLAPWDRSSSPGFAVAVVDKGAVVYKKGYGIANLEYDIPIGPATVFHIASVSKQFTVFAILLLERAGMLSLEDDVRKYIPELADFGVTITLRHLASHTSGLRDQWDILAMAGWRMDDIITTEHVMKLVGAQKELNFKPGDEFLYCNTGFTLLAEVVARLTNMSFAEFTKIKIFDSLKMKNTFFYDDYERIVRNRAYSYQTSDTGLKKSVLNFSNVGPTGLFTTVEDLSLWAMNFSDPIIGDSEMFKTMDTPAVLNNGESFGGALGQFVGTYKGLKEIQHAGSDAGYRSYLTRFPNEDLSVIILSNSADIKPDWLAHEIVDIYLQNKIQIQRKEPLPSPKPRVGKLLSKKNGLHKYKGKYKLSSNSLIGVDINNGKLTYQIDGDGKHHLEAISYNKFYAKSTNTQIHFNADEQGIIRSMNLIMGGKNSKAQKLVTTQLQDFTGSFYSGELSTTYTIQLIQGKLIVKHQRIQDFELFPLGEDAFKARPWFFKNIKFIRNKNNEIIGCRVSSNRAKNVAFKKIVTP